MQLQGGRPARNQVRRPNQPLLFSVFRLQCFKIINFSDGSEHWTYLCYLVWPSLTIATCVGLPEIFVALIQFCWHDQITLEEQLRCHFYNRSPHLLRVKREWRRWWCWRSSSPLSAWWSTSDPNRGWQKISIQLPTWISKHRSVTRLWPRIISSCMGRL